MAACDEGDNYMNETGEKGDEVGDIMQEKVAELSKTKEELKRAKDSATQSWLDSKPLIDELEKLQAGLASAKNQSSMSNVVMSELKSELESTNLAIKSKVEEETKATKMTNEVTQALDQLRQELETIKQQIGEERRERSKLKQLLRMRRQTLRTLQLTLRAIRIESEAYETSAAEALAHINSSETDSTIVQLNQEEYLSLKRRAKEEKSLAEWRISVSVEQKLAAEATRDAAASRLKELTEKKRRRRILKEEKMAQEVHDIREEEEQCSGVSEGGEEKIGMASPKARAKAMGKSNRRMRRSASIRNKKLLKEKKRSFFQQMRRFLAKSIAKLFR